MGKGRKKVKEYFEGFSAKFGQSEKPCRT